MPAGFSTKHATELAALNKETASSAGKIAETSTASPQSAPGAVNTPAQQTDSQASQPGSSPASPPDNAVDSGAATGGYGQVSTSSYSSTSAVGTYMDANAALGGNAVSNAGQGLTGLVQKDAAVFVRSFATERSDAGGSADRAMPNTHFEGGAAELAESGGAENFSSMSGNAGDQGDESFSSSSNEDEVAGSPGALAAAYQNTAKTPTSFSVSTTPSAEGTLSLRDSSWVENLGSQIQNMHQQGRSQITLELDPQGLGPLTLRISTQNNQVSAMVATDNPHVRELLLNNSSLLQQHLQNEGLSLSQFSVGVNQGDGGESRGSGRENSWGTAGRGNTRGTGGTGTDAPSSVSTVHTMPSDNRLISVFA
jgi:flagellar hook-length control protein FliK